MEAHLTSNSSTGGMPEIPLSGSQRSDSMVSDQSGTSSKRKGKNGSRKGSFAKKALAIQIPKDDANNEKNPDFKTPLYFEDNQAYKSSDYSEDM